MEARLERLYDEPYIIRIFPDIEADPNRYTGSAAVTFDSTARIATLRGLVMPGFNAAAYEAVKAELARHGAVFMQYERRNIGEARYIRTRIA